MEEKQTNSFEVDCKRTLRGKWRIEISSELLKLTRISDQNKFFEFSHANTDEMLDLSRFGEGKINILLVFIDSKKYIFHVDKNNYEELNNWIGPPTYRN